MDLSRPVREGAHAQNTGLFAGPVQADGGAPAVASRFQYSPESVVMAVGQYREFQPSIAPQLFERGAVRFHIEPADLPCGLQFDRSSGTIWGTPAQPADSANQDAACVYRRYDVLLSGPAGSARTNVFIKVVDFQPHNFRITHVSRLERNKYMVLIDAVNTHQ